MEPKVTIVCITYNQENFIKQALDSFVMQKTNFDFQVIVSDDCSTDNTPDIIKEYENQYPRIIKSILRNKNLGSYENFIDTNKQISTKYVAFCDGDDYWCDENKLQKQVDFLEANPDYSLCFHPVKMIYENTNKPSQIIGKCKTKNPQSLDKLTRENFIPSNSVMYRYAALNHYLLNYPSNVYPADWFNHILVGNQGKMGYLPVVMAVYRRNEQGISYTVSQNPEEEIHLKYGIKEVNFSFSVWNMVKDKFPHYYHEIFIPTLQEVYYAYLKAQKYDEINILTNQYSQYFKDFITITHLKNISKFNLQKQKYKKLFNIFFIASIILLVICILLIVMNI